MTKCSNEIYKNLEKLKTQINDFCLEYKRDPESIKLIAVSKFKTVEQIEAAYACGIRDFGENYIQEWLEKTKSCAHMPDITWHIIGNIQKNKIKYLNQTQHKIVVQTIDSVQCAQEFEKKITKNHKLDVFIQLKIDMHSNEKHGCDRFEAQNIIKFLNESKKMKLLGFMGVGIQTNDRVLIKSGFVEFVKTSNDLWNLYLDKNKKQFPEVSLGMSDDFEVAIQSGSTLIRIGSLIFGARVK